MGFKPSNRRKKRLGRALRDLAPNDEGEHWPGAKNREQKSTHIKERRYFKKEGKFGGRGVSNDATISRKVKVTY